MQKLKNSIRGNDTSVASGNEVTEARQTHQLEKACIKSPPAASIKASGNVIEGAKADDNTLANFLLPRSVRPTSPPINSPERKAIMHAIGVEIRKYEARKVSEYHMQAHLEMMRERKYQAMMRERGHQTRRPKSKSESSVHLANAREDLKETLKRKGVVKKVLEPKTTVKSHETSQRNERQS